MAVFGLHRLKAEPQATRYNDGNNENRKENGVRCNFCMVLNRFLR